MSLQINEEDGPGTFMTFFFSFFLSFNLKVVVAKDSICYMDTHLRALD